MVSLHRIFLTTFLGRSAGTAFFRIFASKESGSAERSLSLIQFAVQQVLGYGFVTVTRAWRAYAVLVKVKMADGSDENPPYAYGYHHPYYGHLYAGNTAGIAYPSWPQSLTAWSTGNQSPSPFFYHVDLTATASVCDEQGPTVSTAGDRKKRKEDGMPLSSASARECRSSSKEDPTYSYLVKIIPPNNKKRATVQRDVRCREKV